MATLLAKKADDKKNTTPVVSQPSIEIEIVEDPINYKTEPTVTENTDTFSSNSTYSSANTSYSSTDSYQSSPSQNLTQAGDNAATGAKVLVENDNTDWINKKWRPAMGWTYMITCVCDFVVFPILWSILQALSKGQVTSQWQPVTLMGAGLYHVSMGAILGVTAFMRSKEKIEGKA